MTQVPPVPPLTKSLETQEYERLFAELTPQLDALADGVSPLVPGLIPKLLLMTALLRHAGRLAVAIGLSPADFQKKFVAMAQRAYAPRVEIPKVVV